jgi:hypothetical protein
MEMLRPAIKNGGVVNAVCPIHCNCECLPEEEDGGVSTKCGWLSGYLTDRKGLKARCRYQHEVIGREE